MKKNGKLIAEFVLIVVGVLAALAAETAFEDRRDRELRDEYLVRIEADLLLDTQAIQSRLEFFGDVQRFSGDVLDWLVSDEAVDKEMLLASFYAAEVWPFLPTKSTFEDLQSTGNIRLIDDIELRTSMAHYYNRADTARNGWNPSERYRQTIRGVIPNDVQALIRQNCPTTDAMDLFPSGFPPCELPGVDYEQMTQLFERLKSDVALHQTLTYRHSELGVMNYLLKQQLKHGNNTLDIIRAQ